MYKPHLFAEILSQKSWVRLIHETIALKGSKLACLMKYLSKSWINFVLYLECRSRIIVNNWWLAEKLHSLLSWNTSSTCIQVNISFQRLCLTSKYFIIILNKECKPHTSVNQWNITEAFLGIEFQNESFRILKRRPCCCNYFTVVQCMCDFPHYCHSFNSFSCPFSPFFICLNMLLFQDLLACQNFTLTGPC